MPGLLRGVARTAAVAGTATAVSNRVSRRQAERWQQQGGGQPMEYRAAAQAPAAQAPQRAAPAAAPQASSIDQLKELAQLKDQGILTEEEFAAQKAKILNA
jgi:hypothetical protein